MCGSVRAKENFQNTSEKQKENETLDVYFCDFEIKKNIFLAEALRRQTVIVMMPQWMTSLAIFHLHRNATRWLPAPATSRDSCCDGSTRHGSDDYDYNDDDIIAAIASSYGPTAVSRSLLYQLATAASAAATTTTARTIPATSSLFAGGYLNPLSAATAAASGGVLHQQQYQYQYQYQSAPSLYGGGIGVRVRVGVGLGKGLGMGLGVGGEVAAAPADGCKSRVTIAAAIEPVIVVTAASSATDCWACNRFSRLKSLADFICGVTQNPLFFSFSSHFLYICWLMTTTAATTTKRWNLKQEIKK